MLSRKILITVVCGSCSAQKFFSIEHSLVKVLSLMKTFLCENVQTIHDNFKMHVEVFFLQVDTILTMTSKSGCYIKYLDLYVV